LDSTNTFALLDCNLNVSCLTPSVTPGVAYNIVGRVGVAIITNNGNSMVKFSSASYCICENTGLVIVEGIRTRVN
jgi:hypothetical protein